ncbi:MAG: FtsX-like permease family protein [Cytophagales bacterium]|nr:FtsX-like permease family protein [Cytophagales bacterium]
MPYQGEKHAFPTLRHTVDEKHFDLFEIPIKEGRGFKAEEARDHIIVNEAFIKSAEIEDPIGKTVNLQGLSFTRGTIIGVSKNTVFFSSKLSTIPTIYFPGDSKASIFAINVKSSAPEQELIAAIEPVWEECFYPYPLKYKYLDDSFLEAVKKERKIAKISSIGSGIGIFLALFGLLGLVSINIKEKLKRVSISRVLGASSLHIAAMISNRFIIPIALSLTLGISMGVYISLHWLENYPFRISLEWYHLTIASFLILGLAGAIIWSQLRMALNKNPVIYLKED